MCIYETRVRSRGDIGRVAANVWCMAVLIYVYICIYICMFLIYMWELVVIVHIGDSSTKSRGHRPRSCECVVYGGFDVYMYTYVYMYVFVNMWEVVVIVHV